MKTHKRINLATVICTLCLLVTCLPQQSMAQRFGHGGGGGNRGGGGGNRGGGEMRGGGGHAPAQVFNNRSINGGSRNIGNHFFGGGALDSRPVMRGHYNEGVYHHMGGFHPYAYHPYHPYYWGPRWHPFGFFAAALTVDAIMFSIANQPYYYDNGVYYQPSGSGYSVVPPPVGAVVTYLPAGYETTMVGDNTYYYYGGTFYISQGGSYRVVPAPEGAVVSEIPQGATEQQINGEYYLLYNNAYFLPISQNGQDAYQVVNVN